MNIIIPIILLVVQTHTMQNLLFLQLFVLVWQNPGHAHPCARRRFARGVTLRRRDSGSVMTIEQVEG